ncbi:spermidine synthase [Cohnella endophytica]|uniref:Spermidine synthase n=1 Tax=Cohnella endophytica TaxID=2419778 RepID=A0A494Y6Z6_9BACL|nr:fused MFS/spermidine synthase [Cohnella endophytica]RKP58074.1 spermidine synthase [Cohnella endophytica]
MQALAIESSPYNQEVTVFEVNRLYGETGRFRCLKFADEAIQGAIDLNEPGRVVLPYQRALLRIMELIDPAHESAFVIGHGIGTIAGHLSSKRIKVAEIDANVVALSRRYFDYRGDNVAIGDGREILSKEEPNSYGYIVLDAFNSKGTPLHLTTTEFFEIASERLAPGGAFLLNIMGKIHGDRLIDAIHSTLRLTYENVRVFALPADHKSEARNLILMGSQREYDFQPQEAVGVIEVQLEQGHIRRDV